MVHLVIALLIATSAYATKVDRQVLTDSAHVRTVAVDFDSSAMHVKLQDSYVKFWDGEQVARVDDSSRVMISIRYAHHEIHAGNMYSASYYVASVANGDSIMAYMQLGAAASAHMEMFIEVEGKFNFWIYEGREYNDTGGDDVTERNRNRWVSDASNITISVDPTLMSAAGTQIDYGYVPGGTGPKSTGGESDTREEWIFKKSTNYLLKCVNASGQAKGAKIHLLWYE